jgi:hypothetical protein
LGALLPLFIIGFIQAYFYHLFIDIVVFVGLLLFSGFGIVFALLLVRDTRKYSR